VNQKEENIFQELQYFLHEKSISWKNVESQAYGKWT
jgi:hypothetical protein